MASLAHGSTRGSWRDMASFPHIKEDPPDWAAAAAHEGGLFNSSCASYGVKQEDVVKKSGCRASKIPGKKALLGCREGKIPEKTSTFGRTKLLSGPLNRLNAMLSLLHPLDRL